ncbi:GNAT family N-acetyltransferase [Pseudoalteromonas sp. DL2-H2.2]|uniref:GNAT family N-acetyltransferase n=1 Tax=Pseudoalteromonas sp. DL2-H2.2 TaxID=2908889 RepID=UPI001F1CEB19|nr:GNAT family N-acetyltransferase [Pseudoalteromonas sp. DL2-H2.2]MCF2906804.1 GNAT family N-acetyltransferase [Pseudoalteromonas sp. DL2-H2.2]
MSDIITHTERLIIRRAQITDAEFIYELLNQQSFIDNIADKQIRTLADARKYIESAFFTPYDSRAPSPYIVTLNDGTAIGICGLYQRPYLAFPDLGYAFLDRYCAKGYAFEAADALLTFVYQCGKYKALGAITSPNNLASNKLLNKLSFVLVGTLELAPDMGPTNLYVNLLRD